MRNLLSSFVLAGSLLASTTFGEAFAEEDDKKADRKEEKAKAAAKDSVVREIVRGPYVRANVGTTAFIGARRSILRPGTTLDLSIGGEFVDKEKFSVGAEFTFTQALHNASLTAEEQGAVGFGPNQLIEGDIHTLGALIGVEASAYPVRRVGLGGHLGGGLTFVPLLMNKTFYQSEVVGASQGDGYWGGPQNMPPVHQGPKPTIYAGFTLEYYTKLSHFSFGADIDFIYTIGLDFGLKPTGYLKYTF